VFVSGSADVGSSEFDYTRLLGFARKLGKAIIDKGHNLVSGFGTGIGSEVIVGAVEGASGTLSNMHDRLILRPFPQTVEDSRQAQVFHEWREAMIALAGFSIFLAGNKLDDSNNSIPADGVREEFDTGRTPPLHNYPIPVGATGYVAQQIWQEVSQEPQ